MTSPPNAHGASMPVCHAWLMVVCILLLQMGFSYYLSFQTLAVFLLSVVLIRYRPVVLNQLSILLVLLMFAVFVLFTAMHVPVAISENSDNIAYTTLGVLGYAAMIILAPNLAFKSPEGVLRFFRFVSTMTIMICGVLIAVTDLSIFPLLSRETLILQNATLVTNYTSVEALVDNFAYLHDADLKPNIDLLYGEQSYLAVVLFACVVSRIVSDNAMRRLSPTTFRLGHKKAKWSLLAYLDKQGMVVGIGLSAMIYIQSFSSFFYVAIVVASLVWAYRARLSRIKLNLTGLFVMLVGVGILGKVAMSAYGYYAYRFNSVSHSGSFDQRFSSAFDFGLQEYIVGITSAAQMPPMGFQNGVLYIIGIAGIGGIAMMVYVCYRVHLLSRHNGLSAMTVLCVLGVFSQNGGIFSPNKVVILSLVLIPLACGNRRRRRTPSSAEKQAVRVTVMPVIQGGAPV